MSYESAASELPRVNAQLTEASDLYSEAYEDAKRALSRCYQVMAHEGGRVARLRARQTDIRKVIDRGPSTARVLDAGEREDPSLTPGLREDAADKGEDVVTHRTVLLNMVELIGGLARISGCSEEHKLAAAELRGLWERAQIGGAKAIDYTQARVDTSGAGEDRTELIGADARAQYANATTALGMVTSSLLERVIIHDQSLRDIAGSDSGAAKRSARHRLFEALNRLVDVLGVRPGSGAKTKPRRWNDGSSQHFTGDVATRR